MKKQTSEILLLAGALIILAAVAVWQVRQMNAGKPSPVETPATATAAPADTSTPTATPAAATSVTPAAVSSTSGAKLVWVEPAKVTTYVAQVKSGRNPFQGGNEAAGKLTASKPVTPTFRPRPLPYNSGMTSPGGLSGVAPLKEVKLVRTLAWITPQELAQAFADAKLEGVKLMARKGSEQVIIVGIGQDNFQKAVDLANAVDVPPPAPNFELQGIVSTDEGRYVALRVDGKYYTLKEGNVVPTVGWVVTRVTPNRVTLVKEKQSVQLLLAGGHV
jgi:hypothetical protein